MAKPKKPQAKPTVVNDDEAQAAAEAAEPQKEESADDDRGYFAGQGGAADI